MLNPIKIYGTWDDGIVLDNHMIKSVFLGYDENGKEMFENTRTELGELIYNLKYKNKKENVTKIINLIKDQLEKLKLKEKIDIVIPVPPSKKSRKYQPVFELAKEIAKYLKKEYEENILSKKSMLEVKDGYNIVGTIEQIKKINKKSNILIIDDLYSTGKTLNETCKILKKDNNVNKIYCIAMTKTKG